MRRVAILASVMFVMVISFQNCGQEFELKDNLTLESIIPPNPIPQLAGPGTVVTSGINVPLRSTLLAVDSDTDQNDIRYEIVKQPINGQLSLESRVAGQLQNFQYMPAANFTGVDSFSFKAIDINGNESQEATFNVNITLSGIGKFIGTWSHPTCVPNTAPVVRSLQLTTTNYTETSTIYTDDCATAIIELSATGTHTIGKENQTIGGGDMATEYDQMQTTRTMTPLSEDIATQLNTDMYCGYADWVANTPKDVRLTGCDGNWAGPNLYSYIKADYTNLNNITLRTADISTGGMGVSPADRTQGLYTHELTKQ